MIQAYVLRTSQKAILVAVPIRSTGVNAEVWLPLSQIEDPSEEELLGARGTSIEIEIPLWLAEEKELADQQ